MHIKEIASGGMIIRVIYHIADDSATYIKCSIHNAYVYFYVYVCVRSEICKCCLIMLPASM